MADQVHDWEIVGARDLFFGVIVADEFRTTKMDADARARFYASGEGDIANVLSMFDEDFGARPTQGQALDIGCGVGPSQLCVGKSHAPRRRL